MFLRWDTAVGDVRHFCEGATIVLITIPRFYGVTCAQVLFYVSEYSMDRWWMKSIVSVYAFPALRVLSLIKVALLLYAFCSVRRISSAEGSCAAFLTPRPRWPISTYVITSKI